VRTFLFALGVFLLSAGVASAQTRDPTTAEALFLAGRDAVERGDFAVACPKFAASDSLDPAAGTRINLADCEERLSHPAAAWRHWREALELLAADDARMPLVRERIAMLEKVVPRLTVKLEHAARGVRVLRDDVEIGVASLGLALPVEPGEHVITVSAEGRETTTTTVVAKQGESTTVVPLLGPLLATPPAEPGPEKPPLSKPLPFRSIGFVAVATGGVAIATSMVFGAVALAAKSDLDGNCFPRTVCNDDGADAAARGRTSATIATVTGVAGVALVLGGIALVVTHPKAVPPQARPAPGWGLTAGAGGLSLSGHFQ